MLAAVGDVTAALNTGERQNLAKTDPTKGVRCEKGYHLNAPPSAGPCGVHFPSSIFHPFFHLRNLKNVEKAAISCVLEVYR